jgi:hypothetical protein
MLVSTGVVQVYRLLEHTHWIWVGCVIYPTLFFDLIYLNQMHTGI